MNNNIRKPLLIIRNIVTIIILLFLVSLVLLGINKILLHCISLDMGNYSLVLADVNNKDVFIVKEGMGVEGDYVILEALDSIIRCQLVYVNDRLMAYINISGVDYYLNVIEDNVIGVVTCVVNDGATFIDWFLLRGGFILFFLILVVIFLIFSLFIKKGENDYEEKTKEIS